jgi:hypothetical protein
MPLSNAGCAAGVQELGKLILPSPSEDESVASGCWATHVMIDGRISKIRANLKIGVNLRGNILSALSLVNNG